MAAAKRMAQVHTTCEDLRAERGLFAFSLFVQNSPHHVLRQIIVKLTYQRRP